MIPGARGCSPQSCAFRDHFTELKQLGVSRLYGLSTQDTAYLRLLGFEFTGAAAGSQLSLHLLAATVASG
jgi:hypothetical protein